MRRHRVSREGYKAKYGYTCMNCLEPGGEIHHIVPLSKGGPDDESNLIILCHECHTRRSLHRHHNCEIIHLKALKYYFESKHTHVLSEDETQNIQPIHHITTEISFQDQQIGAAPKLEQGQQTKKHLTQLCLCGCGKPIVGRKGKRYFDRLCKDRHRHHKERWQIQAWRGAMDKALRPMGLKTIEIQKWDPYAILRDS